MMQIRLAHPHQFALQRYEQTVLKKTRPLGQYKQSEVERELAENNTA